MEIKDKPECGKSERTNIRYITREQVPDDIDFASVDVSFYLFDFGSACCLPIFVRTG